jgi:glycosyltransferase involved in cell wall biosynthesis
MTSPSNHTSPLSSAPVRARPIRVACVYIDYHCPDFRISSMSGLRFFRMAEALARRGYEVDIVLNRCTSTQQRGTRLREVPFRSVRWDDYDVVKTFFHRGFESLMATGGGDHPFIVSKLGSVVGSEQTSGVHFYGHVREKLFRTQQEIARRSRFVTVLTDESVALWRHEHGHSMPLLRVPTGVDAEIPPPGPNPYKALGIDRPIVLFAGNLYSREQQPEVNALWQERLNQLGRLFKNSGLCLIAMGSGETDNLERDAVIHVGRIEASEYWDWQRYASVGLVLAQGPRQDNESSKIYYYLRTGLPVVCERGVPNAWLLEQTAHGAVVEFNDLRGMAEAATWFTKSPPALNGLVTHMIKQHSWDARAAIYDPIFDRARAGRS